MTVKAGRRVGDTGRDVGDDPLAALAVEAILQAIEDQRDPRVGDYDRGRGRLFLAGLGCSWAAVILGVDVDSIRAGLAGQGLI